jgi:hypothetical protein
MESFDLQKAKILAANITPHDIGNSAVAVQSPGVGEGYWVGASSAIEVDSRIYIAYRRRSPVSLGRGGSVVIASSVDGENFNEVLCTIEKDKMDAESLERPTLILTDEGKWRLYLSCATWNSKHWGVKMLEADSPEGFGDSQSRLILPGDSHWGVKDTVIQHHENDYHLWATYHPLDDPGQEDRMYTKYAKSHDGIKWDWQDGFALEGRKGKWDERGARVTAVRFVGDMVIALYDGRATAEQNFDELTGVAVGSSPDRMEALDVGPLRSPFGKGALRYADIVSLSNGDKRIYWEMAKDDGSHEIRTELL